MSRIGRTPITVPSGVTVTVNPDNTVKVKGAKGELTRQFHPDMKITLESGILKVQRPSDSKEHKSLHGLTRSLLNNMVIGVSTGFEKELHLVGVGFRIVKQGDGVQIFCGFSHPVDIAPVKGITFTVEASKGLVKLKISGTDKEKIGQIATDIRALRPPEPYKGKGFKYSDEVILRKLGKAGKAAK